MQRRILVLLALCAFAAAMIPRQRRAVNPEDEEHDNQTTSSTTAEPPKICAPQTPCAWSIYKPVIKLIDFNLSNSYCVCEAGKTCQITEDDTTVGAYVYRCRLPSEAEQTIS